MQKPLEEEETLLEDGTIDHLLHSDGEISHYSKDKEQKSCLDTDED